MSERRGALCLALILRWRCARAAEECRVPDPPPIPDGATAADGEMLQARADVAAFVAGERRLPALSRRADRLGRAEGAGRRDGGRHDAAIARMNEVAAKFNAQLEIWKKRSD